ncbi:MAG TPA: hypothetical protein PL149_03855, partial [Candidatus Kapabacteria bacterium]|nr:hypothetical protein [Candidatus Kapabacteria bacterium]
MIDLKPTNIKLQERAKRIVMKLTGVDYSIAEKYLVSNNWSVKHTLLVILGNISFDEADRLLNSSNGKVRIALGKIEKKNKNTKN